MTDARLTTTPAQPHHVDDETGPSLPLWRMNLLRIGYLLIGVGLAIEKWPLVFSAGSWELMEGVVNSMLVAMSLLALVGLRYPLRMLPLLLFESIWKLLWLGVVALPLWRADRMDVTTGETVFAASLVVVILVVIPWDYVLTQYVQRRGDRWLLRHEPVAH